MVLSSLANFESSATVLSYSTDAMEDGRLSVTSVRCIRWTNPRATSRVSSGHLGSPPRSSCGSCSTILRFSSASRRSLECAAMASDQLFSRPKAATHLPRSVSTFGFGVYLGPAVSIADCR